MKKLFAALLGLSVLGAPAIAEPEVKPYSLDAQGCMKLRECTRDVHRIRDFSQFNYFIADSFPVSNKQEITELIKEIDRAGVEIYIADAKYFTNTTRGLYYTDVNRLFLNDAYVYMPNTFLSVLRHEGWHAAQDCMAGTLDNTFIAIIHQDGVIPNSYQILADARYGLLMPGAVPWEAEAMFAADVEEMTLDAVAACARGRMWETYEPTPMTKTWLIKNGYIKD
jgi:hypothetical protein